MIVMLDDIGNALYKKLKAEADSLAKIQNAIKYKKQQAAVLVEQWLELEAMEFDDDADSAYLAKHKLDIEIGQLEIAEKESLRKIYAYTKTRSA